jgi:hypothetical protein
MSLNTVMAITYNTDVLIKKIDPRTARPLITLVSLRNKVANVQQP